MTTIRLYPHRTASAELAVWKWWLIGDDGPVERPELVTAWDYATPLRLMLTGRLDLASIAKATGLERWEDYAVLAIVDCKSTQQRFVASGPLVIRDGKAAAELEVVIGAGLVAESLTLSAGIVMSHDRHGGVLRTAERKGSRLLFSETQRILLEGDAGRFPVEAVAFNERGLGTAAWTLMVSCESLQDSFMGSVRLLINTDHPAGRAVLQAPSAERFSGVLRADLLRSLLARIGQEGVEPGDYEPGSIGAVVGDMCEGIMGCSLIEAVAEQAGDPISFELHLQSGLDPYRGLV